MGRAGDGSQGGFVVRERVAAGERHRAADGVPNARDARCVDKCQHVFAADIVETVCIKEVAEHAQNLPGWP